jgi:carbonic anhydrase/acetyltransferase-like protein (isoleucine patch superfamily)
MNKTTYPNHVMTKTPNSDPSSWIAPGAHVMGAVTLKAESSIWYTSVLRGDINQIRVGERSNIQDGSILHVENDRACLIGNDVTVGHRAILHGCTIEDGVLIGMGAIVLNGALIRKGAVIGAGAVITENTVVGENELWVGVPAKCIKGLEKSYETNIKWAAKYVKLKNDHKKRAKALSSTREDAS